MIELVEKWLNGEEIIPSAMRAAQGRALDKYVGAIEVTTQVIRASEDATEAQRLEDIASEEYWVLCHAVEDSKLGAAISLEKLRKLEND